MTENAAADQQVPQRGSNDTPALTKIVEHIRALNAEIKERKQEIKELADDAWEKCGYSAKAVKEFAKESSWDKVQREARRQLEEEIDRGRAALGFLADTPLGQAEMQRMEEERLTKGWKAPAAEGLQE